MTKKVPGIVQDYRTPIFRKYGINFKKKSSALRALSQAKKNGIPARIYKISSGYRLRFT